jgi:hypothetical protein
MSYAADRSSTLKRSGRGLFVVVSLVFGVGPFFLIRSAGMGAGAVLLFALLSVLFFAAANAAPLIAGGRSRGAGEHGLAWAALLVYFGAIAAWIAR